MSGLEEIIETQKNDYIRNIREISAPLNQLFNDKLFNFLKFAETNDTSYLVKETKKLRAQRSEAAAKVNVDPEKTTKPEIRIKKEKVSIASVDSSISSSQSVKKNGPARDSVDAMPAPSTGAIRKKKIKSEYLQVPSAAPMRSTRSKTKPRRFIDEQNERPSDVIVQNATITMIDISEDKEPEPEKNGKNIPEKNTADDVQPKNDRPIRTTRTKTRHLKKQDIENDEIEPVVEPTKENGIEQTKRTRSTSRENVNVTQTIKKSKLTSSTEQELNKTAQTDYEDAVSNVDPNEAPDNNTMVINSTVIVENPKLVKTTNDNEESESKKKNLKTPPRTKSKKQQIKEIFSPFEKSSMKKKVEAFGKLGSSKEVFSASKIPLYKESGSSSDPGSANKPKLYTPFSNKFMPKTCSTSRNPDKPPTSSYNASGVSMKSLSALKASQAEYREREKRRQEKEMEAQLKKEALLQAQTEEKRRKREEKQMKALQLREVLQKEKEKQLEVQKIKEDKHKQMVAKKEEKLQKTKDEAEKKRLLAKQKAKMIAKEKERNDRSPKEAKMADTKPQGKTLPLYMATRLPLLPTDDCYDSDDERYREKRYVKPNWCRDHNLTKQLYAQLISGEKVKNTLFGCINRSPDLVEMFENIDPRKLKRTSSAQRKKPPRYTLFSMTSDILFSEDSEDDEKKN